MRQYTTSTQYTLVIWKEYSLLFFSYSMEYCIILAS